MVLIVSILALSYIRVHCAEPKMSVVDLDFHILRYKFGIVVKLRVLSMKQ